jgi:hypothetical protein
MSSTVWQASRATLAGLAMAGSMAIAVPAAAQADDARLRRVEAEIRALQRAVFPDGDGRFFTPEVVTPGARPPGQQPVGTPSETAVTDILARLDALESQLARLTARSEEEARRRPAPQAARARRPGRDGPPSSNTVRSCSTGSASTRPTCWCPRPVSPIPIAGRCGR